MGVQHWQDWIRFTAALAIVVPASVALGWFLHDLTEPSRLDDDPIYVDEEWNSTATWSVSGNTEGTYLVSVTGTGTSIMGGHADMVRCFLQTASAGGTFVDDEDVFDADR